MNHSILLAPLGLFILMQGAVSGQEEITTGASARITLRNFESSSDYSVEDLGIYLSRTEASADAAPGAELTISLGALSPVDSELLAWIAQHPDAKRQVRDFTVDAVLGNRHVTYAIEGAYVASFSTSNSIYNAGSISVQIIAARLAIDGIQMN